MVNFCKQQKMPAIAISDFNNLFGCMEFSIDCQANGIQPIIGSSLNFLDYRNEYNISQVTLLVKNEEGYKNLCHQK